MAPLWGLERGAPAVAGAGAAAPEVYGCRAEAGAMLPDPRQEAIERRRHRGCGAAVGGPRTACQGTSMIIGVAHGEGHEVSHRNVAPRSVQSAELGGSRLVMRMMPPNSGQAGASLRSGMSMATEVSADVAFQNSLVGRVWKRSVISRRCDRS